MPQISSNSHDTLAAAYQLCIMLLLDLAWLIVCPPISITRNCSPCCCAAMGFGAVHCVMRPSGELAAVLLLSCGLIL
jgi:hypothetical protein